MARINTNVSSLIAQSNLSKSNRSLEGQLQRLATGLRINRGADDPAGLIVSERLRTELRGIGQGIKNSERASSVIATAEGALSEVSDLLNSIKALTVEAANTGAVSPEEVAANQLQVDSAIESISRIANTTSFAGLQLLNGSLGYNLSSVVSADLAKVQVFGAQLGDTGRVDVDVQVIGSAQHAGLYLRTDFAVTVGGGTNGFLPSTVTVEIAGPKGVAEITFVSGTSIDSIRDAINSKTSITGIAAARQSAADVSSGLHIYSTEYGSEAFVSVKKISGGTAAQISKITNNQPGPAIFTGGSANVSAADRDTGADVTVLVNGAVATGRGLKVTVRNPELDLALLLSDTFATNVTGTPTSFNIIGGGATFQLGPQVTALQQTAVGIDSLAATRLGGTLLTNNAGNLELQFLSSLKAGGENDLTSGNLQNASSVLETAIDEVSSLRGRLGAFERNVLQTNVRSLQSSLENISASESVIRDADFAKETSELTRSQILVSAGTAVLATANTNAQSVLQLLG